jgi:hypothetical protein
MREVSVVAAVVGDHRSILHFFVKLRQGKLPKLQAVVA